jgi:hypothetical protein
MQLDHIPSVLLVDLIPSVLQVAETNTYVL